MTEKQVKYVRVLLYKEGIPTEEINMAHRFSNGRATRLEDLNHKETQALIEELNGVSKKDKMVNKILSMAHEMRWELPDGRVDIKKIDAWCVKHTAPHKPLNDISLKELPKVVSVFEKLYKRFLESI